MVPVKLWMASLKQADEVWKSMSLFIAHFEYFILVICTGVFRKYTWVFLYKCMKCNKKYITYLQKYKCMLNSQNATFDMNFNGRNIMSFKGFYPTCVSSLWWQFLSTKLRAPIIGKTVYNKFVRKCCSVV